MNKVLMLIWFLWSYSALLLAQTTHYLSFTPRSINPSFWLCKNDGQVVSSYFNTYPTIGYGFLKSRFSFFINSWLELPYFSGDAIMDTVFIGSYSIREGIKISLEIGGGYSVPIKQWLRANVGMIMRGVIATYDVISYNGINGLQSQGSRQSVFYYGMPIFTGITMFPIKKVAGGLSVDLIWHLLYGHTYSPVVITLLERECRRVIKPYIPEIRLTLHFIILKTQGKNKEE